MIRICEDGIYELYFQGKYYGCVKVEDLIPSQAGVGNLHVDIIRFSHHILNRMKRDEESLMQYLRNSGYRELIACADIARAKNGNLLLWSKFVKLFGFSEPKLFTRKNITKEKK